MRNIKMVSGLVAAGAMVALVGCSSGTSTSSSTAPSASATSSASASGTKAEDLRASAAAVATGLTALDALAGRIAAAPAAQGKTLSEGIEPLWKPIEGTVKANSQAIYFEYEGAFTQLESGDVTQAQQGAKTVSATTKTYLAKYPA